MQKQIEQETGVKIIFPSSKEDTAVGIHMPAFLSEIMFSGVRFYLFSELMDIIL
jgi:hypothetical protein